MVFENDQRVLQDTYEMLTILATTESVEEAVFWAATRMQDMLLPDHHWRYVNCVEASQEGLDALRSSQRT